MIRIGTKTEDGTIALYNIQNEEQTAAGFILSAYSTEPPAGCACDDIARRALSYTAGALQRAIDYLLTRKEADMDAIKTLLLAELQKLNEEICTMGRSFGLGVYIGGVISYVHADHFICLPFGGAFAYLWDETLKDFTNLQNKTPPAYYADAIINALGGMKDWTASFSEGNLVPGNQILGMTSEPLPFLMDKTMEKIIRSDHSLISEAIFNDIPRDGIPVAVMDILIAPDFNATREELENDDNDGIEMAYLEDSF